MEAAETNSISEATRRTIMDWIRTAKIAWAGRLEEIDFLSRLYDLTKMPSHDTRFRDAKGDIFQHRVNNATDWEDDWIFTDSRFNLLRGPDQEFLRVLCEMVHPVVRADTDDVKMIVDTLNEELRVDGWQLVEGRRLSGRPIYVPQRGDLRSVIFEEPTGWSKVDRQVKKARDALDSGKTEEDFQSIGLVCREALISVAQAAYDATRHPPLDATEISETDAKRKLEALFAAELKGPASEAARAHARAALSLALALQHKRTADFKTAALCAEATSSVINLVAVLSDRRLQPATEISNPLTVDFLRKNFNITADLHEYRLSVLLRAIDQNPVENYTVEVTFPRGLVVDPGTVSTYEGPQGRDKRETFRISSKVAGIIYPGEPQAVMHIPYRVNNRIIDNEALMDDEVRAIVYVPPLTPTRLARKVRDLQIF